MKNKFLRVILPAVFIAFCAGLFFLYKYTGKQGHKAVTQENFSTNLMEDFSLSSFVEGGTQKKFILEGKALRLAGKKTGPIIIGANNFVHVVDPRLTFYDGNKPISIVRAKTARFQMPPRSRMSLAKIDNIEFSRDIVVITSDKRTLTCGDLAWDIKKGRLLAKNHFTIGYEGQLASGDSIETDVQLKDFNLKNKFHEKRGG